jgi:hypothetical protein
MYSHDGEEQGAPLSAEGRSSPEDHPNPGWSAMPLPSAGTLLHVTPSPEEWRRIEDLLTRLSGRQRKTHSQVRGLRQQVRVVDRKVDRLSTRITPAANASSSADPSRFGVGSAIVGTGLMGALLSSTLSVAMIEEDRVDWVVVGPAGLMVLALLVLIGFGNWISRS